MKVEDRRKLFSLQVLIGWKLGLKISYSLRFYAIAHRDGCPSPAALDVGRWRSIVLAFSWVKALTDLRRGESLAENTEHDQRPMGPLTSTVTLGACDRGVAPHRPRPICRRGRSEERQECLQKVQRKGD